MTACLACHQDEGRARGLCSRCYQRHHRAGTLDQYPTIGRTYTGPTVECRDCGRDRRNAGRGLCDRCYWHHKQHGTLEEYPVLVRQRPEPDDDSEVALPPGRWVLNRRRRRLEYWPDPVVTGRPPKALILTEAERRRAHRDYQRGLRDGLTVAGEREYQRAHKRQQRARAA